MHKSNIYLNDDVQSSTDSIAHSNYAPTPPQSNSPQQTTTTPSSPKRKSKQHLKHHRINNFYSSSQVNPNYSSTNLSKIQHHNQHGSPTFYSNFNDSTTSIGSSPYQLGTPPLLGSHSSSYTSIKNMLPMTPPASETTSPEPKYFDIKQRSVKGKNVGSLLGRVKSLIPPVNYTICSLCFIWYFFSIISSNSIKLILTKYKYPVTVTQLQFLMNAGLSLGLLFISNHYTNERIIPSSILPPNRSMRQFVIPTKFILSTTVPMGCFQFVGHLTSHKATSDIPVSLVHTIKALSPLVTVLVYRFIFNKRYRLRTYLTLIPLSVGIMMTCYKSKKKSVPSTAGQVVAPVNNSYSSGLIFAFISMLIFVSQNMFAKSRLTPNTVTPQESKSIPISKSEPKKLDNLTIIFYCSIVGFLFTCPIYITSEFFNSTFSLAQLDLTILSLVVINGLGHFIQTVIAFQILGLLSPIDYSIANILKRIFIILMSFLWEAKNFTPLQTAGLFTTLVGLYSYDRWGTQR
ncbi:Sly41 protein [Candida orthopsilosis Co 90-125]|uniref:Sly41 protein n=1 Tax=Candida orthopsilosis (strain 90-125) TaxID=1136231 RepID=H8X9M5_CANO9|nr:Sly41 protein [Candida orthopsilosis Co 90-125]CCG24691.1 Sly41 protein [Candida orthopsilosis Co 90-125]